MTKISKKVWPKYFEKILSGKKNYELRLADFEVKPGDILILKEWNPKNEKYTGREVKKTVTYVGIFKEKDLHDFWPKEKIKKHGLQIISLKD